MLPSDVHAAAPKQAVHAPSACSVSVAMIGVSLQYAVAPVGQAAPPPNPALSMAWQYAPPEPDPEPNSDPDPEPHSEPDPEPNSEPDPEPHLEPEPEPNSEPEPEPHSEPEPEPHSEPEPEPHSEPEPEPHSEPEPEPDPLPSSPVPSDASSSKQPTSQRAVTAVTTAPTQRERVSMFVSTSNSKSNGEARPITKSGRIFLLAERESSRRPRHPWAPVVPVTFSLAAAALLAAALVSVAPSVFADGEANETVRLEYLAPASCVSESGFLDAVRTHTTHVTFAPSGAHRTFEVSITREGDGFSGSLTSVTRAGERTRRSFHGHTCEEMTAALALLVALAIDPKTVLSASLPPSPPPAPPALLPMPARVQAPLPAPAVPLVDEPRARPARWEPDAGIHAVLATGVSPVAMTGFGLFGGGAAPKTGWWSPSLRAGVLVAATGVTGAAYQQADFLWVAGEAEACPSRWNVKTLSLWPCLHGEAGGLRGEGTAIFVRQTTTVPWLAVGGLARLRWTPGADTLPPRKVALFAELALAASTPLARPTFVFESPRVVIHQPPPALASLAVAAGVTIP